MRRTGLCGGWTFTGPGAPGGAPVTLPHDFSIGAPRTPDSLMGAGGGWFQGGAGVYARTLDLPPAVRTVLVVEGCMGCARVSLNGEPLAEHPYGYTEFHVDLSGKLRGGDALVIEVDHTALPDSRWYTGSGLYRPVWIAQGGEVSIPLWSACAAASEISAQAAELALCFDVENLGCAGHVPISLEILDPEGKSAVRLAWEEALPPGRSEIVRRLTLPRPALWSLDSPALYTAVLAAGEDRETVTFGVRRLELSPARGLVLNGAPVKLRGGCIHHDNGPLGACAHPGAERRKLEKLKAAGYNAVRCAHNPPGRAFLDACDRLGLLVMDEAFDCWAVGKTEADYHKYFEEWWRRDLAAMVLRDRNHPSVFCWSVGNEIPERCEGVGAARCRELAEAVRRLDPTRPVSCGVNGTFVEGGPYQGLLANLLNGEGVDAADVPEEAQDILRQARQTPRDWGADTADFIGPLDLAGYNYLDFRYAPDRARFPARVVCGTESFPKLMAPVWRRTLENPHVIGDFTWAAWDYLGESGIGRAYYGKPSAMFAEFPYHLANCGDFDICGAPRPQSWMRRALWGLESRPGVFVLPPRRAAVSEAVTAWGWPDVEESWTFPGQEGRRCRVEVYTNAEEAELWLDDTLLGRAGVKDCKAEFWVDYRPGKLRVVNLRDGKGAEEAVLETAGAPVSLALAPEEGGFAPGGDTAYVWAEVRDGAGRRVPWAGHEIACTLSGPAGVIASASGDPEAEHSYASSVCAAWRGRALFILRSGGDCGTVEVAASAPGLTPARCALAITKEDKA